jgi:hypothetical protein
LFGHFPNPDEPEPIRLRRTRNGAKTLSLTQQITFSSFACRILALAKPGGLAKKFFIIKRNKLVKRLILSVGSYGYELILLDNLPKSFSWHKNQKPLSVNLSVIGRLVDKETVIHCKVPDSYDRPKYHITIFY